MNIGDVIARHRVCVLQFSGGKDSLACLWLLEPYWSKIIVAWGNTGDAFPETLELMRRVRDLVPNFMVVESDVKAQQKQCGLPVDVLPVRNHPDIMFTVHPQPRPAMQSCFACCRDNLWTPMQKAMQGLGADLIIRGQRLDEQQRTPVRSGDVFEGVEYLFPIESWTSKQVREYISTKPLGLPPHYHYMDTGLDCMHCTAHLFENLGKRRYMRKFHPVQFGEVSRRLDVIKEEIAKDLVFLEQAARA